MKKSCFFCVIVISTLIVVFLLKIFADQPSKIFGDVLVLNDFAEFDKCFKNSSLIYIGDKVYYYEELRDMVYSNFRELKFDRCENLDRNDGVAYFVSGKLGGYRFVEESYFFVKFDKSLLNKIKEIHIESEPLMGYLFLGENFQRHKSKMRYNDFLSYVGLLDLTDCLREIKFENSYVFTIVSGKISNISNINNIEFKPISFEDIPEPIYSILNTTVDEKM